ncbi:hypothetical protein [Plebeiibacterium sediminum]|uniref:Uncharacterized protein n=1 Tax=Plebeiibacterium sediminum TaxID=2992112 RepID=A0AAE3M8B7_9BACT|nr:hypothetical protein [Plebeiobacterium sediminum]MCW3788841.1 hypothetical protein [Plebeiobacterium sediminum]
MNKNIFLIGLMGCLMLFSCQKEDELTPSGADVDYFLPAEDNMSEEAELKREFFAENDVRLLFSDTIHVDTQDTIVINFDYNFTVNHTGLEYIVEKIQDIDEKKAAAEFVSEGVIKRLGSVPPPYSVLLAKDFMSSDMSWGYEILTPIATQPSLKTTVITVGDILSKEDWEKTELANSVLSLYLGLQLSTNYVTELKEFFTVSSFIYDDMWNAFPTFTETDQINGFLEAPSDYSSFNRSNDLQTYLRYMFSYTEDDFRAMYGSYDRIITKMEALKSILNDEFNIEIYN